MTLTKQAAEWLLLVLREGTESKELRQGIANFDSYDWQALHKTVVNQGIFSLFYSRLITLKPAGLPPDFLQQFKNAYLLNLEKNLFCERELLKIISHLQSYDIAVIALKGAIFARLFYQDIALRLAPVDLDLLIKKEDLLKAQEILGRIGYSFLYVEPKKDFLQPVGLDQQIVQICLSKKAQGLWDFIVDMHTSIRGFSRPAQIQALWQQARYISLGGKKILVPSNEDLLLYLSVISISLLESVQLRYLYDMHRLITIGQKELEWDKLILKAKDYNLETCLYFPLTILRSLFRTEIPSRVINDIAPGRMAQRLVNLWINKERTLSSDRVKFGLLARLVFCRYLYSADWGDFLSKLFIKFCKEGRSEVLKSRLKKNSGAVKHVVTQ